MVFAFLKLLRGRLVEETLLGGRVRGNCESRYVRMKLVVALILGFVRPRSERCGVKSGRAWENEEHGQRGFGG